MAAALYPAGKNNFASPALWEHQWKSIWLCRTPLTGSRSDQRGWSYNSVHKVFHAISYARFPYSIASIPVAVQRYRTIQRKNPCSCNLAIALRWYYKDLLRAGLRWCCAASVSILQVLIVRYRVTAWGACDAIWKPGFSHQPQNIVQDYRNNLIYFKLYQWDAATSPWHYSCRESMQLRLEGKAIDNYPHYF